MIALRGRLIALVVGLSLAAFGLLSGGVTPAGAYPPGKEHHPRIRAAIHELREAKRELEKADHDFGGHKKEAIEAVNHAIKQLELALKYDRK